MLNVVMLAWYDSYGGGQIGSIITQWQEVGIFSFLLPFLLIFTLVYGILQKANLFRGTNKAVNPIIGLTVALIAIQFEILPQFFSVIFPKLGVALVILLVALILVGLVLPKDTWVIYTLFAIGAIIMIVVLVQTAGELGWAAGYWWNENWPIVAGAIFILVIMGVIVGASKDNGDFDKSASPFLRALQYSPDKS
ncbi:hypothetical protein CMI44_00420 [Candidatus Pacearchaeota archaeon]|nr:hypothetical protein [Candidatus Pacearchaeota archaeon]